MRALRFTLILFALIFAAVAVIAVRGAAQPHAAELIVEPTEEVKPSAPILGAPVDLYASSPEESPANTAEAPQQETDQPEALTVATPSPSPTEEPGTPAWIIGLYVNLRSGPGTSYEVIGTYDYGTPLCILDTKGNWAHIIIEGQEGYMTRNLIDTQHPDDEDEAPKRSTPPVSHTPTPVPDPYADGSTDSHTHSWTQTTVNHPAVTHTIYHDAVYETVHHDAVYDDDGNLISDAWDEQVLVTPAWREHVVDTPAWIEKVTVCSICGRTK